MSVGLFWGGGAKETARLFVLGFLFKKKHLLQISPVQTKDEVEGPTLFPRLSLLTHASTGH